MKIIKTILGCALILAVGAACIWTLDLFRTEPVLTAPEVEPRVVRSELVKSISKRITLMRGINTHGAPRSPIDAQAAS